MSYNSLYGIYNSNYINLYNVSGVVPIPSMTVSRTTAVAPAGFVFDMSDTTIADATINPFNDLIYVFDFGDGSAPLYEYGLLAGQTTNRYIGGAIMGHVYENIGTYTARGWVINPRTGAVSEPVSQTITLTDPNVFYAGTNTICVSSSGNFTGAPAGASLVTSSDFSAQFTTATFLDNKRILFRAGETFTASVDKAFVGGSSTDGIINLTVGRFGAGVNPVIVPNANNRYILTLNNSAAGTPNNFKWISVDINSAGFTSVSPPNVNVPFNNRFLVGNATYYKCKMAACSTLGGSGFGNVYAKIKIDAVNNSVTANGSVGFYAENMFSSCMYDTFIDNKFGGEHCLRTQGSGRASYVSIYTARPAANKHYMTIRGSVNYTTEKINLTHNHVDGSIDVPSATALQIAPQNIASNEFITNVNVKFNYIRPPNTSINNGLSSVAVQATNVRVAYNIVEVAAEPSGTSGGGEIRVTSGGVALPANNVTADNNTIYFSSSTKIHQFFIITTTVTNTKIQNNIVYQPNRASNTVVNNSGTGTIISNNTANNQISVNPLFVGTGGLVQQYRLQPTSPYINFGNTPIFNIDALGYVENIGASDAGALTNVNVTELLSSRIPW